MKSNEVFVAGGLPTVTYVDRSNLGLERSLRTELIEGYKIVCVTGPTKSGKTVLCHSVLGDRGSVWVAGGKVEEQNDFWEQLLSELDIPSELTETQHSQTTAGFRALVFAKAQLQDGHMRSFSANAKTETLRYMRENGLALIIDDFHYMPKVVQAAIVRSLKNEIFLGLSVLIVAVPHQAFAAINVANEMEGRFSQVTIPPWSNEELLKVAELGFPELRLQLAPSVAKVFARESFGSPLLMQRFCLRICLHYGIEEAVLEKRNLNPSEAVVAETFEGVAKQFGLPAYNKLLAGPQSRRKRKQRQLRRHAETADIYQCILFAIAKTGPKPEICYNEVRETLQDLLVERDMPQKNEVTSALSYMSKIAEEKIDGEPVVEWQDETLHLTDPFLMFHMRWMIKNRLDGRDISIVDFKKLIEIMTSKKAIDTASSLSSVLQELRKSR